MKQQIAIIDFSEQSFSASRIITCHLTCYIYFKSNWQICISPKLWSFFYVNVM